MDITALVKRNAQRQSVFKQQYLKAVRQSQEELNNAEHVGLTEYDHNQAIQLNPTDDKFNLYEENNLGVDYKLQAIEKLSTFIKDNSRGDLLSGIVDDLETANKDYVPMLVLNFPQIKADVMKQYSGKKIDNIYQFEQFLTTKLSQLTGKVVDNKADIEARIDKNRKEYEKYLEEESKKEEARRKEVEKMEKDKLKNELAQLQQEEADIQAYWDDYRKHNKGHISRQEMLEMQDQLQRQHLQNQQAQQKIALALQNYNNKKKQSKNQPTPQPTQQSQTTPLLTPNTVAVNPTNVVSAPKVTRDADKSEIDRILNMLNKPSIEPYILSTYGMDFIDYKDQVIKADVSFPEIVADIKSFEDNAKLKLDSSALQDLKLIDDEIEILKADGVNVKMPPVVINPLLTQSGFSKSSNHNANQVTMPPVINTTTSSTASRSTSPTSKPNWHSNPPSPSSMSKKATPQGSRPPSPPMKSSTPPQNSRPSSPPQSNVVQPPQFTSPGGHVVTPTYENVKKILDSAWTSALTVRQLWDCAETMGMEASQVKDFNHKKEFYGYIRVAITKAIEDNDEPTLNKLLDDTKQWIKSNKAQALKDLLTKPVTGHGIFKGAKRELGNPKLTIDIVKLGKGILDVRYKKSRISHPQLKMQLITPNQKAIIKGMLGGSFSHSDYHKLDEHEKSLINQIIKHFNLDIDVADNNSLQERWEIVKAELKAGNNSDHLKQEAKRFLLGFHNAGIISSAEMMKLLLSLGIH